jgi:hypothetical protein
MPLASLSGAGGHCDVIEGERITADQAFGLLRRAPSDVDLERVDDPNVAL